MAARRTRQLTNSAPGGSVVLRGVEIDLDSDIGRGFVSDCCRHIEELLTAEQLRKKYQLNERTWRGLADNEPLQQAIELEKILRIRSGAAKREKAQALVVQACDVLGEIMRDAGASPKHRIDASKALDAFADPGLAKAPDSGERFSIRIDLTAGGNPNDVITIDAPKRKVGPDVEPEPDNDVDTAPLLALITAKKRTEDGGGEPI